jgi:uncharacterized membrane protein
MRHLSRTALLFIAAFSVPFFVELRTVLGLFGIDVAWQTVVAINVAVCLVLTALAILQDPQQSSPTEA